jgi:hypothetical protein
VEALSCSESGDEVAFDDELVIFEKDRTCEWIVWQFEPPLQSTVVDGI